MEDHGTPPQICGIRYADVMFFGATSSPVEVRKRLGSVRIDGSVRSGTRGRIGDLLCGPLGLGATEAGGAWFK